MCYVSRLLSKIGKLMRYKPLPCADRPVCVPVLRQLSFMGHYLECARNSSIHQQLDRMHRRALDHGCKVGSKWGDLPAEEGPPGAKASGGETG